VDGGVFPAVGLERAHTTKGHWGQTRTLGRLFAKVGPGFYRGGNRGGPTLGGERPQIWLPYSIARQHPHPPPPVPTPSGFSPQGPLENLDTSAPGRGDVEPVLEFGRDAVRPAGRPPGPARVSVRLERGNSRKLEAGRRFAGSGFAKTWFFFPSFKGRDQRGREKRTTVSKKPGRGGARGGKIWEKAEGISRRRSGTKGQGRNKKNTSRPA